MGGWGDSAEVSGLRGICPGPPVRLRSHSTSPTPLLALTGPSGNRVHWVSCPGGRTTGLHHALCWFSSRVDRQTERGTRWGRRHRVALAQSPPSQPQSRPQPQPQILRGPSSGWRYPPPTPKTQIGLVVFRKRQSCFYLSKGSADYAGPRGGLAAGRGSDGGKTAPSKCSLKNSRA